jgi:hypothetical protein
MPLAFRKVRRSNEILSWIVMCASLKQQPRA